MTPAEEFAAKKKIHPSTKRRGRQVCSKLAEFRKKLGLSLRDLAEGSRCCHTTVQNAEAGGSIEVLTALRLAAFFGVRVEDIWSIPPEGSQ